MLLGPLSPTFSPFYQIWDLPFDQEELLPNQRSSTNLHPWYPKTGNKSHFLNLPTVLQYIGQERFLWEIQTRRYDFSQFLWHTPLDHQQQQQQQLNNLGMPPPRTLIFYRKITDIYYSLWRSCWQQGPSFSNPIYAAGERLGRYFIFDSSNN